MTELAHGPSGGVHGEVLDPRSLAALAGEVARRQPSPATRSTYAGIYRAFCQGLGADAGEQALTAVSVRAWRDSLEAQGHSAATIAKHLSALRTLADALDADPQIAKVRSQSAVRGQPRAISHDEYQRLLRMPDRRTRQGKRDLALLYLLGSAGLRRSEAAGLLLADVDEHKRAGDPRLRQAIHCSTSWWVTVRRAKRGRSRRVPLDHDALEAIIAWVKIRPDAATEHLLLSLPRTGKPPGPLSTRDIARIVARHAQAAGLPPDRRSPHVLRHTFCTHLADAGADVGTIRELAGHADIRTTTIYTAVNDARLQQAIADRHRRGIHAAASG
ncbi:MAG: tyrosine-type recombinase/integrase [Solirubrobacterales bacterium]|nr:tyrosine-type recombinase/integrase [Solirubrobacterales bacterium]